MARKSLLDDKKFDNQCPWNDHGYQCQATGWLADTTNGRGPWYCRTHYAQLHGREAWTAPVVDNSPEALDARVNKIVPKLPNESDHDWAMRCRKWVLAEMRRMVGTPKRSPMAHWRNVLETAPKDSIGYKYAKEVLGSRYKQREPGEDQEEAA